MAEDDLALLEQALVVDPLDPETCLRQAQHLEQQGQWASSLEACRRALALWPDVTPAYALQLRLARQQNDQPLVLESLRLLLRMQPDDALLNSQMGAALCMAGDFAGAIPFLRAAVPHLGHANDTLWNYTMALSAIGAYDELIRAQPLLDRLAANGPSPYPPFAHLASAKLALTFDREAVLAEATALRQSDRWHGGDRVSQSLSQAVAARQPFSLVRLDYALARFACYVSLHANRVLRQQELSAVVNSVWEGWFGATAETLGILFLSHLERMFADALRGADLIGIPEVEHLRDDPFQFGFLAEMRQSLPSGPDAAFTSFYIADILHEAVPYLRPMLSGLPFLGTIGAHPALARKLGHFCGISDIRSIIVPGDLTRDRLSVGNASGFLPERHLQVLEEITVPFPGAVFLVSAPGPLGIIYCGRIKSLGGIAIDIGALMDRWAGY
ncbi:hypothetical protein [Lichenicola sp.]|uniref:hypothetical protein n=1 Tax=Lichenicola sp. TaxID=2804529 RepID=UPI003AFF8BA2